jgi:hypothetical protein
MSSYIDNQYIYFFNDYCEICIHESQLNRYPDSLFSLIHKFEKGNSHQVEGFTKKDLIKIEDFYHFGKWNSVLPKFSYDGLELIDNETLDYLGLKTVEIDDYSRFYDELSDGDDDWYENKEDEDDDIFELDDF